MKFSQRVETMTKMRFIICAVFAVAIISAAIVWNNQADKTPVEQFVAQQVSFSAGMETAFFELNMENPSVMDSVCADFGTIALHNVSEQLCLNSTDACY